MKEWKGQELLSRFQVSGLKSQWTILYKVGLEHWFLVLLYVVVSHHW